MQYQQFAPPGELKSFVKYFWTLDSTGTDGSSGIFTPIADGCPGIMFQHSSIGTLHDQDHKTLPGVFLYGQTIAPVQIHTGGTFSILGVCLFPDALQSVFGLDAMELTGSCLDMDLLKQKKHGSLSDKLLHSPLLKHQINTLSSYLFWQTQKTNKQADSITQYALSQILQSGGGIGLKEIQQQIQLSERSLERKFKQTVGISPKLFSRICRFQESLKQLRKNKYIKLSDIAFENDYADQSHFIRTFKEFTGCSPAQYQKQSLEIAENFPRLIK